MSLSKKDYELLAKALHGCKPSSGVAQEIQWDICVNAIAYALLEDNDRFNCTRFLSACLGYVPKKEEE